MRRAGWVLAVLAVALGCLHLAVAFATQHGSSGSLWFTGAGGGIIAAGLLNVVALRTPVQDQLVRVLVVLANLGFAAMFGWAFTIIGQPQVVVGLLLFLGLAVAQMTRRA